MRRKNEKEYFPKVHCDELHAKNRAQYLEHELCFGCSTETEQTKKNTEHTQRAGTRWSGVKSNCSVVQYSASLTWPQLVGCIDKSNKSSVAVSTVVENNQTYLTLHGTLYVTMVSPLSTTSESNYYNVYNLYSQPFKMRVLQVTSSSSTANFNVFEGAVLAVMPNAGAGTIVVTILTKTARFTRFGASPTLIYTTKTIGGGLASMSVAPINAAESDQCFLTGGNLCFQSWNLVLANSATCPEVFSGTTHIEWATECRNASSVVCTDFLSRVSNQQVTIPFTVTYTESVCNTATATRVLTSQTNINQSAVYNEGDTVNVEIVVPLDSTLQGYVNTLHVVNVWVCTVNDFDLLPAPTPTGLGGGCLSAQADTGSLQQWYLNRTATTQGAAVNLAVGSAAATSGQIAISFTFTLPNLIDASGGTRFQLVVHTQVEVVFNTVSARRRMLLGSAPAQPNSVPFSHSTGVLTAEAGPRAVAATTTANPSAAGGSGGSGPAALPNWVPIVLGVFGLLLAVLLVGVAWMCWNSKKNTQSADLSELVEVNAQ